MLFPEQWWMRPVSPSLGNVLVKGTTNGQITDLNGGFSIKVEHASATLLVSYVGYVRQEVKATSGKILKIVLVRMQI